MNVTQSVRIDSDLIARIDENADLLGYSRNQFCTAAIEQMIELIEHQPDGRMVPALCDMADAMRKNRLRKLRA